MPQFQHGKGQGGGRPASNPGKLEKLTQQKTPKNPPQPPKGGAKKGG